MLTLWGRLKVNVQPLSPSSFSVPWPSSPSSFGVPWPPGIRNVGHPELPWDDGCGTNRPPGSGETSRAYE
jgi:hypothetical protein